MLKTGLLFLMFASLLLFPRCNYENIAGPTTSGTYFYKAYDSLGTNIVSGYFTLLIKDSIHYEGGWHFTKVDEPQNIGPQTGDGKLAGNMDQGMLFINLNPDYVDNNVFLSGQINGTAYSGKWTYTGLPGVINNGSFQAVKYK